MLVFETMSLGEKLLSSLGVTILGMAVTFAVLVIIAYSLNLLRIMFGENKKKHVNKVEKLEKPDVSIAQDTSSMEDDLELIALLTSAIAAHSNKSTDEIFVSSIKPVAQKNSIWAATGRQEQMLRKI